jgi:hypothetical protein
VGFIAKKGENVGNRRKTVCRYTILYAFYENLSYLLYLIITLDRFKVILPTPPYHSILRKLKYFLPVSEICNVDHLICDVVQVYFKVSFVSCITVSITCHPIFAVRTTERVVSTEMNLDFRAGGRL